MASSLSYSINRAHCPYPSCEYKADQRSNLNAHMNVRQFVILLSLLPSYSYLSLAIMNLDTLARTVVKDAPTLGHASGIVRRPMATSLITRLITTPEGLSRRPKSVRRQPLARPVTNKLRTFSLRAPRVLHRLLRRLLYRQQTPWTIYLETLLITTTSGNHLLMSRAATLQSLRFHRRFRSAPPLLRPRLAVLPRLFTPTRTFLRRR
jgi:hypothetical protein